MNYQRTILKNGVRLVTTHMPATRCASIAFFFATGSRYEKDDVAGVSHFIEHMLFKGSQCYPSAKLISEAIEGVGGSFNGFFFQAEDGIRDDLVTGVQTCALPI